MALFIAWQDPQILKWFPVGKLSIENNQYRFVYTKGAKESSRFTPFGRMQDLDIEYRSKELFPLFSNRLLSKSRPEYKSFLEWLNLREDEDDPLALLGVTGGIRETDSLMMFPCPEKNEYGEVHLHFFAHGIRHLPKEVLGVIENLCSEQPLYLMPDPQNPSDRQAIALRAEDPVMIIGYCPRFLTGDFHDILKYGEVENLNVKVEKVNKEAPIQFRLLCSLTAQWPSHLEPCSSALYESLAGEPDEEKLIVT